MKSNLRHLRVFAAVVETGSFTRAAELLRVSQPAVTQAVAKLEKLLQQTLIQRTHQAVFASEAGKVLANRITRAFALLDPALAEISPRLRLNATAAQLRALIAAREAENFTLAARRMGRAQPTLHRAVTQVELEAGRPLFERTPHGMIATRPAQALAQAARLTWSIWPDARWSGSLWVRCPCRGRFFCHGPSRAFACSERPCRSRRWTAPMKT